MMNQRTIDDLALSDFARMFNTLFHSAILRKLHCFIMSGVLLKCIEHFLANRCMQVKNGRALRRGAALFSGEVLVLKYAT